MYCEVCQEDEGEEFDLFVSVFTAKARRRYRIKSETFVRRWLCAECKKNVYAEVDFDFAPDTSQ